MHSQTGCLSSVQITTVCLSGKRILRTESRCGLSVSTKPNLVILVVPQMKWKHCIDGVFESEDSYCLLS